MKRGSCRALLALLLSLAALAVDGLPVSAGLTVPVYGQRAARWAHQGLGTDPIDTIGSSGCALTAAAMVQGGFGYPISPDALNGWLTQHGGYVENDLLLWRTAVLPTGGAVRWKWLHVPGMVPQLRTDDQDINDTPSATLARHELDAGNLVVAEVRLHGAMHFVVSFDPSHLDIEGRYRGTRPDMAECCEVRDTADRVRAMQSGRSCVVRLGFDH